MVLIERESRCSFRGQSQASSTNIDQFTSQSEPIIISFCSMLLGVTKSGKVRTHHQKSDMLIYLYSSFGATANHQNIERNTWLMIVAVSLRVALVQTNDAKKHVPRKALILLNSWRYGNIVSSLTTPLLRGRDGTHFFKYQWQTGQKVALAACF